jgi:hypothetical protein
MCILEIPGSEGFGVSENGVVYSPTGEMRRTYFNNDGYITASIKMLDGRWVTYGVHRLVALAFIKKENINADFVNHLDCNVRNNHVSNLEWVTAEENNVHQALMNTNSNRPLIYGVYINGLEKVFNNLADACATVNCSLKEAWLAIKTGNVVNSWLLKHIKASDVVPTSFKKSNISNRGEDGRVNAQPIKMLDIETNQVFIFTSMAEAARAFLVSTSHIYLCLSKGEKVSLFKNRYLVVLETDDFPNIQNGVIDDLKRRGGAAVIAYNTLDGKSYTFPSAASFYKGIGLSKKAVSTNLQKDNIHLTDGWYYLYNTDKNAVRLQEWVSSLNNHCI